MPCWENSEHIELIFAVIRTDLPSPREARSLSAAMTGKGASLQPGVLRCAAQQAMFNLDGAAGSHEFFKVKQLIREEGGKGGYIGTFSPL